MYVHLYVCPSILHSVGPDRQIDTLTDQRRRRRRRRRRREAEIENGGRSGEKEGVVKKCICGNCIYDWRKRERKRRKRRRRRRK